MTLNELRAMFKAVDDEPEFPGQMPDEMWFTIKQACAVGDQDFVHEAFRLAVRETKRGIRERLERLASPR